MTLSFPLSLPASCIHPFRQPGSGPSLFLWHPLWFLSLISFPPYFLLALIFPAPINLLHLQICLLLLLALQDSPFPPSPLCLECTESGRALLSPLSFPKDTLLLPVPSKPPLYSAPCSSKLKHTLLTDFSVSNWFLYVHSEHVQFEFLWRLLVKYGCKYIVVPWVALPKYTAKQTNTQKEGVLEGDTCHRKNFSSVVKV